MSSSPPSTSSASKDIIFLVGYRGTGKTTAGKILAEGLGWRFLDADELLESRHARTIREIFAAEAEAGFRDKEASLLEELCQQSQVIVATGGGVVLRSANRERLRAGWVVWLTADAETIWQRLQEDQTTAERRPNLTTGGMPEIRELLETRAPLYRACSDLVVDTVSRSPEEIARKILDEWKAR